MALGVADGPKLCAAGASKKRQSARGLYVIPDVGPTTDLFPNLPTLTVEEVGRQRVVRFGSAILAVYAIGDLTQERLSMVSLGTGEVFKQREVATAFGYSESTLSHLLADYRERGSEALIAKKKGPKGPWKMTLAVRRRIGELDAQGLRAEEIAERVNRRRPGKGRISLGTVRRDLQAIRAERQQSQGTQLSLVVEDEAAADDDAEGDEPRP